MQIGMERVRRGSLLALLAVASGCGGKAQTQDSEPNFNLPAAPPPFRGAGTPPRRMPGSQFAPAPPQAPPPALTPAETEPSESMPSQLMDAGAEAPALGDGVADAGATAEPEPESPPVVSAIDAGPDQPPAISTVDAGAEPPLVVGAAETGADAG